MLSAADFGGVNHLSSLATSQDEALRKAFGRYAASSWRDQGANVLAEIGQVRGGHYWLVCDCCVDPATGLSPVMIPIELSHIRRHEKHDWPAHLTSCDFYAYKEEQDEFHASLRFPDTPRLPLPRLGDGGLAPAGSRRRASARHVTARQPRPVIGQVLARLLVISGRQTVVIGQPPASIRDHYAAIRAAAQQLEIGPGLPLESWLRTSPRRYDELFSRVGSAPDHAFGGRPAYGYILGIADGIEDGRLSLGEGSGVAVEGRISVLGNPATDVPFLFIGLVAGSIPSGASVRQAYLQPLVSRWKKSLMVADGGAHRICFNQLYSALTWVHERAGLTHVVEKPLFAVRPRVDAPAVMPDFVVVRDHRRWAVVVNVPHQPRHRQEIADIEAAYPGHVIALDLAGAADESGACQRFRKALIAAVLADRPRPPTSIG